jgi:short-chain fatty acids transporter
MSAGSAIVSGLVRWCTRYIPDSYVIAIVLTVVVAGLALAFTGTNVISLVGHWGDGFWSQFSFTLRMAMVIMTGYLVADARPVRALIGRLSGWPATPRAAVALMAVVSMSLAWVNWGLSIIASALLAKRIGARRIGADFRLLVASAYLGLGCMWHAGLSASAPLTTSDANDKVVTQYLGGQPVPVTSTVFSPFNLILAGSVMLIMTLLATAMQPRKPLEEQPLVIDDDPADPPDPKPTTPAEWLERTPFVTLVVVGLIAVYLVTWLSRNSLARLNIDHVNLAFLGIGAALHGTPARLLRSAERGGRYVWGVLLQFAFYAGIGGILDKSGLASRIASGFTKASTPQTFPLMVLLYSGILNYAVPSGGAKWFIEAPYLLDASAQLGVPFHKTIVAYAWGDMLTDIIQPFWAIPLLTVARLGFRDIMGYCLAFFLVYLTVVSGAFLLWGYLG